MRNVKIINLTPMDLEFVESSNPNMHCRVMFPASANPVSVVQNLERDDTQIGPGDLPLYRWCNIITGDIPEYSDDVRYIVPKLVADIVHEHSSRDDLLTPGIDPKSGDCVLVTSISRNLQVDLMAEREEFASQAIASSAESAGI
jgi:hypothetical protein